MIKKRSESRVLFASALLAVVGLLSVFCSTGFSGVMVTGIQDLGTLGGSFSEAYAINGAGEIVGISSTATGTIPHAFFRNEQGTMTDLGIGNAYGINNVGQVVGEAAGRPFLWSKQAGWTNISFPTDWEWGSAYGINSAGQIVGSALLGPSYDGGFTPFLWTPENGWSTGLIDSHNAISFYGINNAGQIVGIYGLNAYLWTVQDLLSGFDLGPLPGYTTATIARAINNAGQVVGKSGAAEDTSFGDNELLGPTHAYIWSAEKGMVDLGTLGGDYSAARGINDLGQVVGLSRSPSGNIHAFIWTPESGMVDLGMLPDGKHSFAYGINDSGKIVGLTMYNNGETRATLWTVSITTPPACPTIEKIISDINNLVASGSLIKGQGTALISELEAVMKLVQGNSNAASNVLKAFINEVEAFMKAGILSQIQGQLLINEANQAMSGCTS